MPGRMTAVGAHLAIPLLIAANWLAFHAFSDTGYLEWYLKAGPVLSLSAGFLGLIWEDLAARNGLISANPAQYFGACLQLAGAFFFSVGTFHRAPARAHPEQRAGFRRQWDDVMTMLLTIPIVGIVMLWVIVVAPLNYAVTLVTGAPARRALSVPGRRAVAEEEGAWLTVRDEAGDAGRAGAAIDISFVRKPFAVTQAMTALVLWGARLAIERWA